MLTTSNIPNLCKNSALLMIVLYTQILAIGISLISGPDWSIERLGYFSLYIQWISLNSACLLCLFRKKINNMPNMKANLTIAVICILVFWVVESCFIFVANNYLLRPFFPWDSLQRFFAFLILLFLVLRLIQTLSVLEKRSRAESEAKVEALQARINPHFLFNSLNTISELINKLPENAEHAVYSLSKLFRAALGSNAEKHSLGDELSLCENYLDLERWRLGSKLSIDWNVDIKSPNHWSFPKLLLQPILENCISHGGNKDGKVKITADLRETNNDLSIMIINNTDNSTDDKKGNGIALNNIKERLFIMFDDDHTFKTRKTDETFSVIIRIPKAT